MKVVIRLTLGTTKTKNEFNQLSFYIHRIDENGRLADWQINKVSRPYDVFWYVHSGKNNIIVNGIEYIVQKGDLVVFPSQTSFEILESENASSMHHLEIALENKVGPFNLMTLYNFPVVTNLMDDKKRIQLIHLIHLWRQLKDSWTPEKRNPFSSYEGKLKFDLDQTIELLKFNTLTMDWFVHILTLLRPSAAELFPTIDLRLQHLFYFINDNLAEKLSLNILGREVFLSESHLSLLFRQNLKMAPMEYVRNLRLKKSE